MEIAGKQTETLMLWSEKFLTKQRHSFAEKL